MIPQLRRVFLFTALIIMTGACSGPGQLDADEHPIPYEQVILGMPVAPADGWSAFNQRTAYPEGVQNVQGEVIMNITLDDAGRVAQIDPLFVTDEQFVESAVSAVQATEFIPVDSDVDPDGLEFTLSVFYLSSSDHGIAAEFIDMQEELPALNNGTATVVGGKRYLHSDGSDGIVWIEETPPVIIGGIEGIQQSVRFPHSEMGRGAGSFQAHVSFTVNTDGRAENIRIVRTTGRQAFDNEARDAVRRARFIPATLNGEPVPAVMTIPIRWRLR